MFRLLSIIMLCIFFSGCADFADSPGVSVWSKGLWIIPVVTAVGSSFFLYQWVSNYIYFKKYKEAKGYKGYGKLIFGAALAVATIVIVLMVISNK